MNPTPLGVISIALAVPFIAPAAQVAPGRGVSQQDDDPIIARYEQSGWRIIKEMMVSFRADVPPSKVIFLKSQKSTGTGGGGQVLSDVDLVIEQGGIVAYDFVIQNAEIPGYDNRRFFIDDFLEITDVTSDGVPEVLFHSGTQRMSDGITVDHVIGYNRSRDSFTDIAPAEFFSTGTHGLRWSKRTGGISVVIAGRNWNSTTPADERCHCCPSPFQYDLYRWTKQRGAFTIYKHLYGEKPYTDANEALTGDWVFIQGRIDNNRH